MSAGIWWRANHSPTPPCRTDFDLRSRDNRPAQKTVLTQHENRQSHAALLKLWVCSSVAISKQLNAAPYMVSIPLTTGRNRTSRAYCSKRAISRVHSPRPMTVVFSLETKLRLHMAIKSKNSVLRNEQTVGQTRAVLCTTLSTRVTLKLWRRWLVLQLRAVVNITRVYCYRCWTK